MSRENNVRRPRQARSRATVEAILEATAQVLRRDGLEGCTTGRIAERAGVSVGTLYQYFGNKEALYNALIDRLLDDRVATRAELLGRERDVNDIGAAISGLIDELMAVHLADPQLQHQLHRYEAASGLARLDRYQQQMRDIVQAQLVRYSEFCRPLDPELAARVLVHAITGVVERMARDDPEMPNRPEVRREVSALVAGYLARSNPVAQMG